MIDASRFLVRSSEREAWLQARRGGVTATAVAEAATPSGFELVAAERRNPTTVIPNDFMLFGTEAEPSIMAHAHREHGILPTDWLICAEGNRKHLATPDGLNLRHTESAECKTTGKDWKTVPMKYRRQVWWQQYVLGIERTLFLWQLRLPDEHGWFFMPWLEPKSVWIDRDDQEIQKLISTADRLLALDGGF